MADNVLRKPTAHNKLSSSSADTGHHHQMPPARKISAPVHRTTSETMRLADTSDNPGRGQSHHHHHHHGQSMSSIPHLTGNSTSNNLAAQNRTKKTPSFQITSVTDGCMMSNDAGEDSNDDLDESHTEDTSVEHSRLTDIETPSYSEDTFSKDEVFFNTSNASLSTAPVIPTSSQYGLAIVPNEGSNVNNSTNDSNINTLDIASVTENNIINQDADMREVHSHGTKERFKVVKIESTEPFKRGRWTCMDYLDQPSVNPPTAINSKVPDPNEMCISYGVADTGMVVPESKQDDNTVVIDANGPMHPEVQQQMNSGYTVPQQVPQQQYYQSSTQQQQEQQSQQSTQGATLPSNLHSAHQTNLAQPQSMPQGAIPILTQQGCPVTQASNTVAQQPPPTQNMSHSKGDDTTTTTYVPASSQSMSSQPPPPSVLVPQSQTQQQQIQDSSIQQQQTTMQGMQQPQNIHAVPQPSAAPTQQQQQLPQSQVIPPTGQLQSAPSQQQQPQQQQQQQQQQPQQQQQAQSTTSGQSGTRVQMVSGIPRKFQPDQEQDSMMGMMLSSASGVPLVTDAALLESLAEVTQTIEDQQTQDNENMSGTGTVAIDNKIEQAMDLVKSHLMFAVREEVEVLKEKIAELMDRINQLETENSSLKTENSMAMDRINRLEPENSSLKSENSMLMDRLNRVEAENAILMDRINRLEAESSGFKANPAQPSQSTAKLPINNAGNGQ